jgi:serine/threonine protein kinase
MQLINDYKLLHKIGKGSYGEVWKAMQIYKKKHVAIKIEKKSSKNTLKYETTILRYLKDFDNIVKIKCYGETASYNFLIMELLGCQVDEFYNRSILQAKNWMGLMRKVGLQMLFSIKNIHSYGIIHRDIKPGNFLIDLSSDKIKLIDFGLSKQYIDKNGLHKPNKNHESITGTLRYVSINIHNGEEPSRRDDIISMVYILFYLYLGKLPWQGLKIDNLKEKEMEMLKIKREFLTTMKGNKEVPLKLLELGEYVNNLTYEEEPDYDFIAFLLKTIT